jgi:hypothetical protein
MSVGIMPREVFVQGSFILMAMYNYTLKGLHMSYLESTHVTVNKLVIGPVGHVFPADAAKPGTAPTCAADLELCYKF